MKVILHLDLDSYFVSAERTVDPSLNGKPVAISSKDRRSIISAASYEAKEMGVYVPMPFYRAKLLCPDLMAVKPNFALYTILSEKLFELIATKFTKEIEVGSIDECYIDATDIWKEYGSPIKLAKAIQATVLDELKLPCSIGISNNKFLAKMSTNINKPFGISLCKPGDHENIFWDWPIGDFFGIGKKTAPILIKAGIKTIGDLAKANEEDVKDLLGKTATELIWQANGGGSAEINKEHNALKGIGNSKTFMVMDLSNRSEILKEISALVEKVSHRAIKRNMVGKVVSVSIKVKGGLEIKAKSKQITLQRPINSHEDILKVAIALFDKLWKENTIKFVGVHLGKIEDIFETTYQSSVFDVEVEKSKIEEIVSDVNRKMGSKSIVTGKEARLNIKKTQNQSRYIESDRIIKHYDKKA